MSNTRRIKHRIYERDATPRETQIAMQDRAWFDQHPGVTTYTRPAHPLELRMLSLPPGTMCHVVRLSSWQQARAFAPPSVDRN